MNELKQSRIALGVIAGLVAVFLAALIGVTPATAQAAEGDGDSGDSTMSSFNVGGLVFTTENPGGVTVTSVDLVNNTAVITGGDANFTVTQVQYGSTGIADSIKIGNSTVSDGSANYTGTITLNGVTLQAGTAPSSTSTVTIEYDNYQASSSRDKGATVVLGSGTTITGSTSGNAIEMGYNGTGATNDTLVVQSGAKVVGGGTSANAVTLGTGAVSVGACTVEMAGGSLIGGTGSTGAALAFNATTGGTLALNVTADSTIEGSAGAADSAGNPAISVASYSTAPAGLNISGNGTLTILGGNGTLAASPSTGELGGNAVSFAQGFITLNGDGTVLVQGGRGGDNNTTATNPGSFNTGSAGGVGINFTNAGVATLTVNNGSLSVMGGTGGAAYSQGVDQAGANGGVGINLNTSSYASNLVINGGTTTISGGNGGNGSSALPQPGDQGAGAVGIQGVATNSNIDISYNPDYADDYPTVTVIGGTGVASTHGTPAAVAAMNTIGGNNGEEFEIITGSDETYDFYPWIAYSTSTGQAPTDQTGQNGTLQGFAGMNSGKYDTMQDNLAGDAAGQPKWVRVEPAEITGLNAGVVDVSDTPVDYVVAQTAATMVGGLPNTNWIYQPALGATFEGIQNVSTSNFGDLVGLSALSYTNSTTSNQAAITPAQNISAYSASSTDNTFYVVDDAEGNTINVSINNSVLKASALEAIMEFYPGLTLSPTDIPVVYTIAIVPGGGISTVDGSANVAYLYTSPKGTGEIVEYTSGQLTTTLFGSTLNNVTVLAAESIPAGQYGVTVTPSGTNSFIGLFNESGQAPVQVNVQQVNGWDSNAILTAEGGKVTLGSVLPSPTTVQQGGTVELNASYTVEPVNTKISTYSLYESGLLANWRAVFVNQGTGNAPANGVTVAQTGGSTATAAPFVVTSTATVSANATADLGHYRVWPNWQNKVGSDGLPNNDTIYGIVQVIGGPGQPDGTSINVIRLYNPFTLEHLYTTDVNEVQTLEARGWANEDIAWVGPKSSDVPIYRLFNPNNGDHLYTVSMNEYTTLQSAGWLGEGEKLFSAPTTGAPIYRLYNPYMTDNAGAFSHLWTGDFNEYTELGTLGWNQEGVAWHAISLDMPL